MGDLFKDKPMSKEERLLRNVFGYSDETWLNRENEARRFLSEYITTHPQVLDEAVVKVSALSRLVKSQMEYLRSDYLNENCKEEENTFSYAHEILLLGALRWILDMFKDREGDCFIHLCDKGCEAVRSIVKKERAKHHVENSAGRNP